jgi:hypothetical protein
MYTSAEILKYILMFAIAVFLMFFVPFWLLIRAMGKRTKEMRREAEKLGFNFIRGGDGAFLQSLKNFSLMDSANVDYSREHNLLKKQENSAEITLADLCLRSSKYKTKAKPPISLTMLSFNANDLNLPEFYMKPKQMSDKAAPKSGYKDIDFTEHSDFSKTYLLHGKDEVAVRNLFNKPGIINFLEQEEGLCMEGKGQNLIIYKCVDGAPCIVAAEGFDAFINQGRRIFSILSK